MPVETKPRPARRAPARVLPPPSQTQPPAGTLDSQATPLPRPQGWWRGLALVLALVEPTAGLLLALLYWRSEELTVRRFSRWCVALAVLGLLLGLVAGALKGGLGGGDWLIQPY